MIIIINQILQHQESCHHLLKHTAVILVTPNKNLWDGSKGLYKKAAILLCHLLVFTQQIVQVPVDIITMIQKEA